MNMGEKIKKRRKELKLSAEKLGELIGKDRSTIYRYEKNDIENMGMDVVYLLAQALRISPGYLMGWEKDARPVSDYPYMPAYVAAGLPQIVDAVTREDIEMIGVPDIFMGKYAGSKNIYFISVNGESMNKVIPNGSLAAVKRVERSEFKDGDIVVYSFGNEFSVKRFYHVDGVLIFKPDSFDPRFTDHVVSEQQGNVRIHGKVVMSTRLFD